MEESFWVLIELGEKVCVILAQIFCLGSILAIRDKGIPKKVGHVNYRSPIPITLLLTSFVRYTTLVL